MHHPKRLRRAPSFGNHPSMEHTSNAQAALSTFLPTSKSRGPSCDVEELRPSPSTDLGRGSPGLAPLSEAQSLRPDLRGMGAEVFLDASTAGADFAGSEKFKSSRIKRRHSQKCKEILELKHLPSFSLTLQDTHSSSPRACQTHMAKNTCSAPTQAQKKRP